MQLNPDEEEVFKWAFGLLNTDADGSVAAKEFGQFITALGKQATDSQLHVLVNECDIDGNGVVDFEEFSSVVGRRLCGNLDDEEMRDAFRIYDKDNTGFITTDQIRKVFQKLDEMPTDEELDDILRLYDADSDGKLSYEEFVQAMSKK